MSTIPSASTDVVDAILGIDESSPIAQLRRQKPELAEQLQAYYDAIFLPTEASAAELSAADRFLIAVRVGSHTGSAAVVQLYVKKATSEGVSAESIDRARNTTAAWSDQSSLSAAMRHADLVTLTPSQTSAASLQDLKNAGLSPAGILAVSQVIAFVSYQLRLIAGLRAFGDRS